MLLSERIANGIINVEKSLTLFERRVFSKMTIEERIELVSRYRTLNSFAFKFLMTWKYK